MPPVHVYNYTTTTAACCTTNYYTILSCTGTSATMDITPYIHTTFADRVTPQQRQMAEDFREGRYTKLKGKHERAETLLRQFLTRKQQVQLDLKGFFDLAALSGRRYRVHAGTHGNVRLLNGRREIYSYCLQPDNVPDEDSMLAQKFMLEANEDAFLAKANRVELAA